MDNFDLYLAKQKFIWIELILMVARNARNCASKFQNGQNDLLS